MNVVVTGATSFIGVPMIRELIERGHRVYGVVRPGSKQRRRLEGLVQKSSSGLTVLEADLGELDRIGDLIGEQCQWYCHFGWDGSGSENRMKQEVQQKNCRDSLKALAGANSLGCKRFLFSGSQAEYGLCREALSEDHTCLPVSEYGKAKVDFGRQAVEMAEGFRRGGTGGMEYLHARIFSVYGPGDHPWSLVESCLRAFSSGDYISLGECSQMWNYLYITDLVKALCSLLELDGNGLSGYYNVAAPDTETRLLRDYVRMMYEACGCHGSYSYGRRQQNAEGPANLIPDITKLQAATGWKAEVSFEEGIRRMVR